MIKIILKPQINFNEQIGEIDIQMLAYVRHSFNLIHSFFYSAIDSLIHLNTKSLMQQVTPLRMALCNEGDT